MNNHQLSLSIQWHITSNCINRCKHCYMYDDDYIAEDCSFEDFVFMFSKVEEFCEKYEIGLPFIILSGGSPLMNPDIERILSYLYDKIGKRIALLDIPEMLTDRNIDLIKKYGVYSYQVSLDGMEKVHDDIRGSGSFVRTIEACRLLSRCGICPNIMFTVTESNINDLIPLCEYLDHELGEFFFAYDFVVPIGNAENDNAYIDRECAERLMDEYYNFSKNHSHKNKKFTFKPSQYHAYELMKTNSPIETKYKYPMISGCYIGWDSIAILPNGSVLPCRRLPITIGNLKEDSFESVFLETELMRKFRRFTQYQEKCGQCLYGSVCRGCPAISYALTGDPFAGFKLCGYKSPTDYHPSNAAPDIRCSNQEEMELVKSSMKNFLAYHVGEVYQMYPSLIRYARLIGKAEKPEDVLKEIDLKKSGMCMDEAFCLERILLSKKFTRREEH